MALVQSWVPGEANSSSTPSYAIYVIRALDKKDVKDTKKDLLLELFNSKVASLQPGELEGDAEGAWLLL